MESLRYALFRCCASAPHLPAYEQATDKVLQGVGLDTVQVPEFGCCGYPLRNVDQKAWLLASARNLALTEAYGASLVTVCNCCYGTLKHCAWILGQDRELQDKINEHLNKEGLAYTGRARVRHLFQVLIQDTGLEVLGQKIQQPANHLSLALHYGCRILRPSNVLEMENPLRPESLDTLVETAGASTVAWDRKLDCCGAPIWATDEELSGVIAAGKISDAKAAGADAVCVACPFCQLRLDSSQGQAGRMPIIAYPQLLAYCLGASAQEVGWETGA